MPNIPSRKQRKRVASLMEAGSTAIAARVPT
jgi:hypothetical protein